MKTPNTLVTFSSIFYSFFPVQPWKELRAHPLNVIKKRARYCKFNQSREMTTEVPLTHRLSLIRGASDPQLSPRAPVVIVQLEAQTRRSKHKR